MRKKQKPESLLTRLYATVGDKQIFDFGTNPGRGGDGDRNEARLAWRRLFRAVSRADSPGGDLTSTNYELIGRGLFISSGILMALNGCFRNGIAHVMQSKNTTEDEKLFLSRMLGYFDCAWDDYMQFLFPQDQEIQNREVRSRKKRE